MIQNGLKSFEVIPNYAMIKCWVVSAHRTKLKSPELDSMPKGQVCPEFDISLMKTLAVFISYSLSFSSGIMIFKCRSAST